MLKDIFREYDIRGIIGEELNKKNVKMIGYCLGLEMQKQNAKTCSIGHDARLSGEELANYLTSGLKQAGIEVFDIGLTPTPVGYFSTFTKIFDANIQITGSHNPPQYNGFKITIFDDSFYGEELSKMGEKVEELLERNYEIKDDESRNFKDVTSQYVDFIVNQFDFMKNFDLDFVIDNANSVASVTAKKIVEKLNLKAKILFETPDGNFPNHHPDPSEEKNLKDLKNELLNTKYKIGFSFDGDADRIGVVIGDRRILGDELACLLSLNLKSPKILADVKASEILEIFVKNQKGSVTIGRTGHSNIKKAIKNQGFDLGAEVSGHIYFKERFFGFDDAVYTMMRVLELIFKGFDLAKILDQMPKFFSTEEIKVKVTENQKFQAVENLKNYLQKNKNLKIGEILDINTIDGVRVKFENGWALVRASNTTSMIVCRFEAKNQKFLEISQKFFLEKLNEILQNENKI